jgi:histidine triad (HIT) family protein
MPTIFDKILSGQIPATRLHEDDLCIAFRDIDPKAPHHILVIPRKAVPRVADAQPEDEPLLGHLIVVAARIARELGFDATGYRLVINNGPDAGESVPHLHLHLLGGRKLQWPPG